jgi:putative tryptophan/tyrosine transport system substrate-binding protein
MDRRRFLLTSLAGALAAPLAAEAQQVARVPRIGWLRLGRPSSSPWEMDGFREGLRELGYVEGQSLVVEYRYANDKPERLSALAAELVGLRPDVLVTISTAPARALQQATTAIPIVVLSGDPLGSGLVSNLARPGGNTTGVSMMQDPGVHQKRLQLLKEAVPALSRVGILSNPSNQTSSLDAMRSAGTNLGLAVQVFHVERPKEYDATFAAMVRASVQGMVVLPGRPNIDYLSAIAELAMRSRVPAIFEVREFPAAAGLMSYGPSVIDAMRRVAHYVDRIVKGAKASDMPIEQPTKFELVINLKTAKALGLTIPPSLLARADQVIE